ncbi:MAG: transposase [Candidatus Methanomethyliaceae archaeon]
MFDIVALLQCLQPFVTATTLRQFSTIIVALLAMTGRVTMLGISRWAGQGGSYRTVQRFFSTVLPWAQLFWVFFRQHLQRPDTVYILAGDEVVVSKAGRHTHGLDRFFAGVYGRVIPGVAFFSLALIDTTQRRAFPVRLEQVVRTEAEKAASQAKAAAKQAPKPAEPRKPGRPKGSKNKTAADVVLSPELLRIQAMVQAQLQLMAGRLPLTYLVLDGHFGNYPAWHMVQQCGLQLISKLRCDAALYLPYDGPYQGHGPHRKYGDRLDYQHLPAKYLQLTTTEKQIETRIYQMPCRHKEFSELLNVVIIVKVNLQTQAWAHVILFSSDLALTYATLIDYYRLRFQIEFNFRDAKQYWGLEDFMNVTETAVTNAANLSLFMVNVSQHLLGDLRLANPECSVLDLKALCRGAKYVDEAIKMLPEKPEPIVLARIFKQLTALGRIHVAQPTSCSP